MRPTRQQHTGGVDLAVVGGDPSERAVVVAAEGEDVAVDGEAERVHAAGADGREPLVVERRHRLRLRRFHHVFAAADLSFKRTCFEAP